MVKFHKIPIYRLRQYIERAFDGDDELINTYHLVNGDFNTCVCSTYGQILEMGHWYTLECFALFDEDAGPIGYTVITPDKLVYSFGINIGYRSAAIVMDWWEQIKQRMDNEFGIPLWNKNVRAINFFLRNGMEVGYAGPDHVTLIHY